MIRESVAATGRLDVFFANAGVGGQLVGLPDVDAEAFMRTVRVNALSVFLAIKYAAPAMGVVATGSEGAVEGVGEGEGEGRERKKKRARGSIIATASVAGLRSNAGGSDYSASKAAVVNLVQTAAYQLAGSGVRVNAVLPGLTETGMTRAWFEVAEERVGFLFFSLSLAVCVFVLVPPIFLFVRMTRYGYADFWWAAVGHEA